jgi:lysozyme
MRPLIPIVLAAPFAFTFASCSEQPRSYGDGTEARGINVSHYQGLIAWNDIAATGYTFAIIKATQGTEFVDEFFERNWQVLKTTGLVRGASHFLDPTLDGAAQARHALATIAPTSGDLPLIVDVESLGPGGGEEVTKTLKAFLAEVKAESGHEAMIYASPAFWNDHIAPHLDGPLSNPFWIAEYGPTMRAVATLPPWTIWQYSKRGAAAGIAGPVDLDRARNLMGILLP